MFDFDPAKLKLEPKFEAELLRARPKGVYRSGYFTTFASLRSSNPLNTTLDASTMAA